MNTLFYHPQSTTTLKATILAISLIAAVPTVLGRSLDVGPVSGSVDQVSDQLDVTAVKAERRSTQGLATRDNGLGRKCADIKIGVADKTTAGQPKSGKTTILVEGPVVQECP